MADGTVTTTGLSELQRAVEKLPVAVEQASLRVARETGYRVAARARGRVPRGPDPRQRGGQHTMDSIVVLVDAAKKEVRVEVGTGVEPPMLPVWIEHGTLFMLARPFLRPALDAEDAQYRADLERETADAAAEVLT